MSHGFEGDTAKLWEAAAEVSGLTIEELEERGWDGVFYENSSSDDLLYSYYVQIPESFESDEYKTYYLSVNIFDSEDDSADND